MDKAKLSEQIMEKIRKRKFGKDGFIILFLSGVLLMVIAWPTKKSMFRQQIVRQEAVGSEKASKAEDLQESAAAASEEVDYITETEKRIETFLSNMEGVGRVRVMIRLDASAEKIVLKDQKQIEEDVAQSGGDSRIENREENYAQTVTYSDDSGREIPYLVKTIYPKISAVAVCAEGGGSEAIREAIRQTLSALFGLEENRIVVTKMKS